MSAWGLRVGVLALLLAAAGPALLRGDEPLSPEEKQKLKEEAAKLNKEAFAAAGMGRLARALPLLQEALKIREKLYKDEDHLDLADTLNDTAVVLHSLGQNDKAINYQERALEMYARLYKGQDHAHLAGSLYNLGNVQVSLGQLHKALTSYDRAQEMYARLHEGRNHPYVARSLNDMGLVLRMLGQADKALAYCERALEMRQRLYEGEAHPALAASLSNVGVIRQALGQYDKALTYFKPALEMYERLYKDQDHPALAGSLNNMGFALRALGRDGEALTYYKGALAMRERLYKGRDHPDLAQSLNNIGVVLRALGRDGEALTYYEDALAMRERLYKGQDHPDLAQSLSNMGSVLHSLGQGDKALDSFDRALKMRERLYKDQDHPDLARSLNNMGFALYSLGRYDQALTQLERLFQVGTTILKREVAFAPEAEAMDRLRTLFEARSDVRNPYLAITRRQGTDPAVVAAHLWASRAVVSRVVDRRHLAAQDTPEIRALRDKLAALRARLAGALLRPAGDPVREQLLREITEAKEKAERDLLQLLPPHIRPGKEITPVDLAAALPADAVYLDLLRYEDRDANQKPQARYAAFVHGPRAAVVRIDLGVAKDIDDAANAWRELVVAYPKVPEKDRPLAQRQADRHAARLRELVWDKLAASLPKEAGTVYLSVEGDLGRFPFAALPGDKADSVLLERYTFVTVPHGPALVQRLRGRPDVDGGKGTLLAVGGVEYGPAAEGRPGFAFLTGTQRERAQLEKLAGGRVGPALGGSDATTTRLLAELPKATYAHLGTHGQFKADLFEQDRQAAARYQERLKSFDLGDGLPPRTGLGARSPLGYVGLVFAGANTPEKAGPDGGVLTGEAIAGLQLEKLRLVVLSACETGLGANTDTEGVRGLQRAFHVAGCPNVVASLWQVDDQATAALMNAFWEKVLDRDRPLPPERALREAQLLVATRPDLVPVLATRGEGFGKVVKIDPQKEPVPLVPPGSPKRSHPYLWAAFFLSSSGR